MELQEIAENPPKTGSQIIVSTAIPKSRIKRWVKFSLIALMIIMSTYSLVASFFTSKEGTNLIDNSKRLEGLMVLVVKALQIATHIPSFSALSDETSIDELKNILIKVIESYSGTTTSFNTTVP